MHMITINEKGANEYEIEHGGLWVGLEREKGGEK